MRRKTKRTKVRLITEVLRWWIPYANLLICAQDMGYSMYHKKFKRRYRWWIERVESHEVVYQGNYFLRPRYTRMFTSGSSRTCIAALKLMTGWTEHG